MLNSPPWLHWLADCPSTNSWALVNAEKLQPGDVVFTRKQTAGRGQEQRVWYSPRGVLTASFILEAEQENLTTLSLGAGLAVLETVEALLPRLKGKLRIKWPNDVLLEGRKLAGILSEARKTRVVVGIGLNLRVNFAESGLGAKEIGQAISLQEVTSDIPEDIIWLSRLRENLAALPPQREFFSAWSTRDWLSDRLVCLKSGGETYWGHGLGIDEEGRLLLKLLSGEVKAFSSARIISNVP